MTDSEKKRELSEATTYFDNLMNTVLSAGMEGIVPMEAMRHYNIIRNELAKLYVDVE